MARDAADNGVAGACSRLHTGRLGGRRGTSAAGRTTVAHAVQKPSGMPARYDSDPATSWPQHVYFSALRVLALGLLRAGYRFRDRGFEHLPRTGPAIVVSNHVSFIDFLIVAAAMPRTPRFVMHHFHWRYAPLRWFFRSCRVIPIAPRKERPDLLERALDQIDEALREGEVVLIFPEGTMTPDGELQPMRPGVARIVARRPVPVVPVAVRGQWGSFFSRFGGPPMRKLPRRLWAKVEVVADRPIAPSDVSPDVIAERIGALRGAPC